jgi:hypothetical protein
MANPYLDIAGTVPTTAAPAVASQQGNANPYLEIAGPEAAAPETRRDQSYLAGLGRSVVGQGMLLGWGDEAFARARSIGGEDYETALEDERAKVKQFGHENPLTATVGEIGGGFLTPGMGVLAKPAATTIGAIWQGAKLGMGFGAVHGAGSAEGDVADRVEGAGKGAAFGTVLGGAAPVATRAVGALATKAKDAIMPSVARMTGGNDAAADTIMLNWMRSGGDNPATLRNQLEAADRSATFYGGGKSASKAESPLALADLSPTLGKLAGAATRASPEANARAEAFIGSRQTGVTPRNQGGRDLIAESGIETRNPLAAREAGAAPAGQFERVKDALTRAYMIRDKDFHSFGENAYKTEQSMMARLKDESNRLYGDARNAAQNVNIEPVIAPLVQKYAQAIDTLPVGEANVVRWALRQFTTGNGKLITNLDGFDKAKRVLDGKIESAMSPVNPNKNVARILTDIKANLVGAVDGIQTQDVGKKYAAARQYFSSQMEMKEAIEMGRKALREDGNIVADQFAGLSEGQKKLFRLGLIESFEGTAGRSKRIADITQMFENPKNQELLRVTIPRTAKKGSTYSDRPERVGEFLANEKAMIDTRNRVLGNSATQGRSMDDAALTRQTIGDMFNRYKSQPSLFAIGMEALGSGLNKVFGFRQDTAQELARRLFTANPQEREAVLARLESKYGKDRLSQVLSGVERVRLLATNSIASKAGGDFGAPGN